MPFSIIALQSGVTRISLEGTLDGFTIARLRHELETVARASPTPAELELSHLRSISPDGVPVLMSFVSSLAGRGCTVAVNGHRDQPPEAVKAALVTAVLASAAPLD